MSINKLLAILVVTFYAGASFGYCTDLPATNPTEDFIDNGDGTVTHITTGLMWKRCPQGQEWADGQCNGNASPRSWQGSLQNADGYEYAGHNDWRVPNIKELASIVEHRCSQPAVNPDVFATAQITEPFISSTPLAQDPTKVWTVMLHLNGRMVNTYGKTSGQHYLLLVRDAD